jgi:hypothetical protein
MTRRTMISRVAIGASVAAFPAAIYAQRPDSIVSREFQRQILSSMKRLRNGEAEGARIAASTLTLWAAHIEASGIETQLLNAAKRGLPTVKGNHAEMEKLAKAMGADLLGLSVHSLPNPDLIEKAHADTLKGITISTKLREVAAELEKMTELLPREKFTVKLAQLGPGMYCPVCDSAAAAHSYYEYVCALVAVAALLGPLSAAVAADVCASAIAAWLALDFACVMCKLFG